MLHKSGYVYSGGTLNQGIASMNEVNYTQNPAIKGSIVDQGASFNTVEEAREVRDQVLWSLLESVTMQEAVEEWLSTLRGCTKKTYTSGINVLVERGVLSLEGSLQHFALINHDSIVDEIKLQESWSEDTRQARAACYISFVRYLSRRSQGIIKRVVPCREGIQKTFYRTRAKVKTEALSIEHCYLFLEALKKMNWRDYLIARISLRGAKRISEVLSLTVDQVFFYESCIRFVVFKKGGEFQESVIYYPKDIMDQLQKYIGTEKGLVFRTLSGKTIQRFQLNRSYAAASINAGIPSKVTPHVLRATAVTYFKNQNFSDSEIMRVTGHASSELVNAYDKRDIENNITQGDLLI